MGTAWPALRLALCLVLLSLPGLASAQKPDVGPGRTAVDAFIAAFNDVNTNTDRLLKDPNVVNGPCREVVQSVASRDERMMNAVRQLATEMSALIRQVEPIMDVQAEVQKQQEALSKVQGELGKAQTEYTQVMGQVTASKQSLDAIRQNQKDAVGDWLLGKYGQATNPPVTFKTEKETVSVSNTLFGAIVVFAPRKLEATEPGKTTIQFTPALFTSELFPQNVKLGPVGTSVSVPDGLKFVPGTVITKAGSTAFQMREAAQVSIDGANPITWNWTTDATDKFHGAKFDILMGARMEAPMGGTPVKRELSLPVDIELTPGKSFLERFGSLLSPILSGVIGLVTGLLIMYRSKRIDRTDKQKEREEAERKAAQAEIKRREEENQQKRKRLHLPD